MSHKCFDKMTVSMGICGASGIEKNEQISCEKSEIEGNREIASDLCARLCVCARCACVECFQYGGGSSATCAVNAALGDRRRCVHRLESVNKHCDFSVLRLLFFALILITKTYFDNS